MTDALLQAILERRDRQREWLKKNHPRVFQEQNHLDEGTAERAYWHYGSQSALTEVLELLRAARRTARRSVTQ